MPHKRAKSSVRQKNSKERGSDLVPTAKDSIANEAIPKSAQRILNGLQIRQDFKKRKAERENGGGEDGAGNKSKRRKTDETLKILPGESIQHFNRRVEDDLRPLVKTAMDSGRAVSRKVIREEMEAKALKKKNGKSSPKTDEPAASSSSEPAKSKPKKPAAVEGDSTSTKHDGRAKDFATSTTSTPKRLNDIAMAPPELKKMVKGTAKNFKLGKVTGEGSTKSDVLSMAQKVMMEQEREGAIRRYREMKAKGRSDLGKATSGE